MTRQDAYIEGFCKTAEAYGVDPRQLMKFAGLGRLLTVGGKRFNPAGLSKYIMGNGTRTLSYGGLPKHAVLPEIRAAMLDSVLMGRARRGYAAGRALDQSHLTENARQGFLDAIESSRGSGASRMLDNIRTEILNSGAHIPDEADIPSALQSLRDIYWK